MVEQTALFNAVRDELGESNADYNIANGRFSDDFLTRRAGGVNASEAVSINGTVYNREARLLAKDGFFWVFDGAQRSADTGLWSVSSGFSESESSRADDEYLAGFNFTDMTINPPYIHTTGSGEDEVITYYFPLITEAFEWFKYVVCADIARVDYAPRSEYEYRAFADGALSALDPYPLWDHVSTWSELGL